MKVKIHRIYINTESKDGVPFVDQKGNQKYLVAIYLLNKDGENKKVSNFVYAGDPSLTWNVDDEVNIDFVQSGKYWNWKHTVEPTRTEGNNNEIKVYEDPSIVLNRQQKEIDSLKGLIRTLELKISVLEGRVDSLSGLTEVPEGFDRVEDDEIPLSSIPF